MNVEEAEVNSLSITAVKGEENLSGTQMEYKRNMDDMDSIKESNSKENLTSENQFAINSETKIDNNSVNDKEKFNFNKHEKNLDDKIDEQNLINDDKTSNSEGKNGNKNNKSSFINSVDINNENEVNNSSENKENICDPKKISKPLDGSEDNNKITEQKNEEEQIELVQHTKLENCTTINKSKESEKIVESINEKENVDGEMKDENNGTPKSANNILQVTEKEGTFQDDLNKGEMEKDDVEDDEDLLVAMKSSPVDSNLEERGVLIEPRQQEFKDNKKKNDLILSNIDSDKNVTIKAIELKPKDPSEKTAVVYLVKKGVQKPVETIDLLDSDDEDDDVIFISEVGLQKRSTVPKPIKEKRVVPANKFLQSKVLSATNSQGSVEKSKNSPMFTISSVKSINQQQQNSTSNRAQIRQQQTFLQPPSTNALKKESQKLTNIVVQRKSSQESPGRKKTIASNSTITSPKCNNTEINSPMRSTTNKISFDLEQQTEDEQKAKEWTENFLNNLLNPTRNITSNGIELLLTVLDFTKFCRVKTIIEENRRAFSMSKNKDAGSVLTNEVIAKQEEIRSMFIKNDALTEVGHKLASISIKNEVRNGTNSTKGRKRSKELEDAEYAPTRAVTFGEQTVADRRKSLRRESKTNRKQYFAYEDDDEDDTEFLEMLEEQARVEPAGTGAKKKKTTPKRTAEDGSEVKVKKLRIEEGFSIDTPFETDLLTPTWVEGPVSVEYTEQYPGVEQVRQQNMYIEDYSENNYILEEEQQEEQNMYKEDEEHYHEERHKGEEQQNLLNIVPGSNKNFKNVNRAHHCRSQYIDACLLCGIKHNFVVAHYVNNHRDTEVVISRLTQRDTDQLTKSINFGYLSTAKSTAHQYSATCIFCKREMCFALRYWWEHYTMHTGEYGYECSKCGLRRPRRQHAQKHANNECKLGEAKVRVVYHFDKLANRIQAFICKICNYIQIHKENVTRHLRTQHNLRKKLDGNIARVVLLQISRSYQDELNHSDSNQLQYETGVSSYEGCINDESQIDYSVQYSSDMISNDDLSYTICDMLSSYEPDQSVVWAAEVTCSGDATDCNVEQNAASIDESSTQ